jgi:hypothetical protein
MLAKARRETMHKPRALIEVRMLFSPDPIPDRGEPIIGSNQRELSIDFETLMVNLL